MPQVTVSFKKLEIFQNETGSGDDYMRGRVHFDAEASGTHFKDAWVEVKRPQSATSELEVEVGRPSNYAGLYNFTEFSKLVREYCEAVIGPNAVGMKVVNGGRVSIHALSGMSLVMPWTGRFQASKGSSAW